jgi:hypothetical protein
MRRANNAAQIRYRAPEAQIKIHWGKPKSDHGRMGAWAHGRMGAWAHGRMGAWAHGRMGATEDMCGVEIWKGESFKGLRSSREWKNLSLNDRKL